jgi:long-chain fatty acid transport protein
MRKTIVPVLATVLVLGMLPQFVVAGGVDNKQNLSAAYAGSASRNGAIEGADVAAYNPAGIMQMENGMYLEVDGQFLFLNYSHNFNDTENDMTGNPIVPTLFTIYKQDKWAAYGTFTIIGGGGLVEYEDGNIVTETIGNAIAAGAFDPYGLPGGGAFLDHFAGVESIDYAVTGGVSYAVNEMVSVSAGARTVWTTKDVDIHGTYDLGVAEVPIVGKYEQEADAIGAVFGVNVRPNEKINVGLKYETKLGLDWATTIDPESKGNIGEVILGANGRVDDMEYARDLSAVFAAGVVWNVSPDWSISPSLTYYFDDDADWGEVRNEARDGNSYDLSLGVGKIFSEKLSATAGYMFTNTGIDANGYGLIEQMSPPLDANTFAVGAQYDYNEKFTFAGSLMGNFYIADTADEVVHPLGFVLSPEVEYEKTNYSAAVSVQYRFF